MSFWTADVQNPWALDGQSKGSARQLNSGTAHVVNITSGPREHQVTQDTHLQTQIRHVSMKNSEFTSTRAQLR